MFDLTADLIRYAFATAPEATFAGGVFALMGLSFLVSKII